MKLMNNSQHTKQKARSGTPGLVKLSVVDFN